MGSTIIGCGKSLPKLEVANDELKALVDTNDEWISTRTGIRSRHVAVEETATDLAEAAARQALGLADAITFITPQNYRCRVWEAPVSELLYVGAATRAKLHSSGIDRIGELACASPELLRRRLGLENAIAFDLNAACTGFVYGLTVAECMMAGSTAGAPGAAGRNPVRRALVVGAERLTRVTGWSDRNTCVLFGDGAGAAVLEWNENRPGIMSSFITNADDDTNALTCSFAYDAPLPFDIDGASPEAPEDASLSRIDAELGITEFVDAGEPRQVLRMDGPKVFKFAAEAMTTAVHEALDRANLTLDDVACIVPHQANERIIKYAAKKLGRPMDFFQLSIDHTGNTSAASLPMALCDAYNAGRIRRGDKVVLVAFGGGFTSGAVLLEA